MFSHFTNDIYFWIVFLIQFSCTGQNKIDQIELPNEKISSFKG